MDSSLSFIDSVVERCVTDQDEPLSSSTFILPNPLAVSTFQACVSKRALQPGWAPHITTLAEWIQGESRLRSASEFALVHHLYDSTRQTNVTQDDFHTFYKWGKLLLEDFNLIDGHLIEAEHLFGTLHQYKALGTRGYDYLSPTQWSAVCVFWKNFEKRLSSHQENFMRLWKALLPLYRCFRERLQQLGIGYWGMRCRDLHELFTSSEHTQHALERLQVVGLHGLNPAERGILTHYPSRATTRFYWDVDAHYMNRPHAEAGAHLRPYMQAKTKVDHFIWASKKHQTQIHILSTSSATAQVHAMATALKNLQDEQQDGFCPSQVGILLADETLLPLLLCTLSRQGQAATVHLPCPFSTTAAYRLVEVLAAWCHDSLDESKNVAAVQRVVQHPYLQTYVATTAPSPLVDNESACSVTEYLQRMGPLGYMIADTPTCPIHFVSYLERIVDYVVSHTLAVPEVEHTALIHAVSCFKSASAVHTFEDFSALMQLLPTLFQGYGLRYSVPEGPTVHVLSIKGSLALDFKFLFFLGMQEGLFPSSPEVGSHIPHSLRKGYGLPTIEQYTSIQCAYPFYRILSRACRATFFYSTQGVGEMSRYLRQLMFEWPSHVLHQKAIRPTNVTAVRSISIDKRSTEVWNKLQKLVTGPGASLSPSALNLYLDCRLKFYFTHIARLEGQSSKRQTQSVLFGQALHQAMERLYRPLVDLDPLTPDVLDTMHTQVSDRANEALRTVYTQSGHQDWLSSPLKRVMHSVLTDTMHQLVRLDRRYTPFVLLGVEVGRKEPLHTTLTLHTGTTVTLRGVIDRVDRKLDRIRVLDYKSGLTQRNIPNIAAVFTLDSPTRNAAALQALFYAWLLTKQPTQDPTLSVTPGIIGARDIFTPHSDPLLRIRQPSKRSYTTLECIRPYQTAFETHLKITLQDLLDPEQPFDQTTVASRCLHCPYRTLCQRGR